MNIDGNWQLTEARVADGPLPQDLVQSMRLEINGTGYTIRTMFNMDKGFIVYFPGTQPARMEIHGTYGPNTGRTFFAIYRVQENDLEILYDLSGTIFPPNFEVPLTGPLFHTKFKRI